MVSLSYYYISPCYFFFKENIYPREKVKSYLSSGYLSCGYLYFSVCQTIHLSICLHILFEFHFFLFFYCYPFLYLISLLIYCFFKNYLPNAPPVNGCRLPQVFIDFMHGLGLVRERRRCSRRLQASPLHRNSFKNLEKPL